MALPTAANDNDYDDLSANYGNYDLEEVLGNLFYLRNFSFETLHLLNFIFLEMNNIIILFYQLFFLLF